MSEITKGTLVELEVEQTYYGAKYWLKIDGSYKDLFYEEAEARAAFDAVISVTKETFTLLSKVL
jgi:hypothetical protein